MDKYMILVIDGCTPEYLMPETAPNLYRLAGECGFVKQIKSAVPTVTNVNHACILSGQFPEATGIAGNYYYDPVTKAEGFIDERGFMKAPTIFDSCRKKGVKTALLTVKGKVLGVYGENVSIGISAQNPDRPLLDLLGLGLPPGISETACTEWIMQAALACVKREDPGFLYCTTNDYVFHHYGPGTLKAMEQIRHIDTYLNEIHVADPDRRIYVTADHGMNRKHTLMNFGNIAAGKGIGVYCLAPLKDRYVENHSYQEGGILYLFLEDKRDGNRLVELARSIPGIETVLEGNEAADRYHLPQEAVGDYVIFAAPGYAFGEVEDEYLETGSVRTHGSLHERIIPLATVNPKLPENAYEYSKDIVANMMKNDF